MMRTNFAPRRTLMHARSCAPLPQNCNGWLVIVRRIFSCWYSVTDRQLFMIVAGQYPEEVPLAGVSAIVLPGV
jgi:hypothetical protein